MPELEQLLLSISVVKVFHKLHKLSQALQVKQRKSRKRFYLIKQPFFNPDFRRFKEPSLKFSFFLEEPWQFLGRNTVSVVMILVVERQKLFVF